MMRRTIGQRTIVLALLILFSLPQRATAVGTAFTYQGQLQQSGSPGTGPCDFRFMLFDTAGSGSPPTGGSQIGSTATADGVQVSNGLFTLPLDFGAAAFNAGNDRWLQIAVRCPAGSGSYQTLAPRQPLTATPFALFANSIADGSVSSAKLAAGAVTTSQLAPNAVTAAQIADGTITTNDLANAAVNTAKIGDGQVTSAKLAPGAVTTSQLATNAVTAAQIADGTITANDLANGAVSTAKIGDGQVTAAKLVAPLRLTSSAANTTIGAFDGTSTGLNGVGVSGKAGSGIDSAGVFGSANAGAGVAGESDNGDGVRGFSRNGTGVYGEGVGDPGVWGESDDDGVFGVSTGSGDGVSGVAMEGAGVHGESIDGTGVLGEGKDFGVKGTTAEGDGVIGMSSKSNGAGVHGIANVGMISKGVSGESNEGIGVAGVSQKNAGVLGLGPKGVGGIGAEIGVFGTTLGSGDGAEAVGVHGKAIEGIGVRGETTSGYAGYFVGPVLVTSNLIVQGQVVAGVKFFKIDHPLDPANKYLMHASVESPDMKNIYDGVVVLDTNGEAVVDLPQWFEALNRDFRYQLTCIGGAAPVYVADEVNESHFRIAGGAPGLKVSWQVTGIRKDAFAVAHPVVVESEKSEDERGRYLAPVEMGMPASLSVNRVKPLKIPGAPDTFTASVP